MNLEFYTDFKDAACRQTDPEVFFPNKGSNVGKLARKICRECPERIKCVQFAIDHPDIQHGIWGGLLITDIAKLRRMTDEAA